MTINNMISNVEYSSNPFFFINKVIQDSHVYSVCEWGFDL